MRQVPTNRVEFTKDMKDTHTILVPMMLPIHFGIIAGILNNYGYKIELLTNTDRAVIDDGLKNIHNDICYPALLIIGQMINALQSGRYDINKTAVMISQTGGGCRASNYIHMYRKALKNCGLEHVPVISINMSGLEKNSGFKLTPAIILKAAVALIYGDVIMCLSNQCKPYEKVKGETQGKIDAWVEKLVALSDKREFFNRKKIYNDILNDFASIDRTDEKKVKVGIVGEIFMKYSPFGNNYLEDFLIKEGAEPVVSGVMDFMLYCFHNKQIDAELYNMRDMATLPSKWLVKYITSLQKDVIKHIKNHGVFTPPSSFDKLLPLGDEYINKGVKMGEGWLLTSEMIELIHSGVYNIVATQPFGCLPNHIVAKGMVRKIKDKYPDANIVAIDYDPSATSVNQENRLKLMLANAKLMQKKSAESLAKGLKGSLTEDSKALTK